MKPELLRKLGLYIEPGFLNSDLCRRLAIDMDRAALVPATVRTQDGQTVVEESSRKTRWATLSGEAVSLVQERLGDARARLEDHFSLTLTDNEAPQFLVYRPGDYYRAHVDWSSDAWRRRQVSTIAFVNGESDEPGPGSYGGGALTFFGHLGNREDMTFSFPVTGEPGLLVAFPSDRLHEVTQVTHGMRYTIATWYI